MKRKSDVDLSNIVTTKRKKTAKAESAFLAAIQASVAGVKYTSAGKMAGGKGTLARLGPLSFRNRNSNSIATKPPGIAAAKSAYPGTTFVSGHLLNAALGGSPASKNVTILSSSGNGSHKKLDNNLIKAAQKLTAFCKFAHSHFVDDSDLGLYIRVTIIPSAKKWDKTPPGSYICRSLTMKAMLMKRPDPKALFEDDKDAQTAASMLKAIAGFCNKASGTVDNNA